MISEQKQRLRVEIRKLLGEISPEARKAASVQIQKELFALPQWQAGGVIALFHPLPSEPDCLPPDFSAATFCFPHALENDLRFHSVDSVEFLVEGKWGIQTPDAERHPILDPEEISLVVVPGLAFDRDGGRMGRGKGFYDRALAGVLKNAFKVGVCFASQVVDHVPCEAHDVKVDRVISA
ncbi:MAG: 5-formyltetrahydrofolate cyclo-ligase [Chthoniobacterales bacterium]